MKYYVQLSDLWWELFQMGKLYPFDSDGAITCGTGKRYSPPAIVNMNLGIVVEIT